MTILLTAIHILGLSLGLGAATTKTVLLLRCRADPGFIAAYLKVHRLITRVIITGLVLLVLSGMGFFLVGVPLTGGLIAKLVLVTLIVVLGPLIDNVAEPRYAKAVASLTGSGPSPEFASARRLYVTLEITATILFYVIAALWLSR
jgi:hypothetical protein